MLRIASFEGIPLLNIGRPSEEIFIKDFKKSFSTANPLCASKMRRWTIIASSWLVSIVGAPPLTLEGFKIFSQEFYW